MAWRRRTASVVVPAWVEVFDGAPVWHETADGYDPDAWRAEWRWNAERLAWLDAHPRERREFVARFIARLGEPA